jgi:type IV secretory pathway TrbD component
LSRRDPFIDVIGGALMTSSDTPMLARALAPTSPLLPGEREVAVFEGDVAAYTYFNLYLAGAAMVGGVAVLWAIGSAHIWTGAAGALMAITLRGLYLFKDEVATRWVLTDRRLLGPGPLAVPLHQIAEARKLTNAAQVITRAGDKYLLKYQADAGATCAAILSARSEASDD